MKKFVATAAAALILGVLSVQWLRPAPPPIPLAANPTKLERQLQDYLAEQVESVRQQPRDPGRRAQLGMAYAVNGLWSEAAQTFETVYSLDPGEPLAVLYIGVAAAELGKPDAALRQFQTLTQTFPHFAPGFFRLGEAALRTGKVELAGDAFQKLTDLAPAEWRGFSGLGEVRIRQGRFAEALPLLERAIQLSPDAGPAHSLLGQAYRGVGRAADAETEALLGRSKVQTPMLDAWSQDSPRHMRLLQDQVQLANDYTAEGQPLRAVEVLAKAWTYHPDNLSLINQLAIALNRSGQPKKAHALALKALEQDPNYVPALVTLVFVLHQLGDFQTALTTVERAISLAPKLAQPWVAKADVLLALERDQEALGALETAHRIDPQNPEILIEMGNILWRNLKRPLDAREQYAAACHLDPVSVTAHMRLLEVETLDGDPAQARSTLERLQRIAPQLPIPSALSSRLEGGTPP